jgi:pSer/pThr/pTyr-binding forkhead associated (FHA) protein
VVETTVEALIPRDVCVLVVSVFEIAERGWANMNLKLIVLAGAKEGTQIPLKKDKFIIGRASECTLRAGSSAISRRHCAIVRKDNAWFVRDLGSRNGTFLNDNAVAEPTRLNLGDEIRVGPLHFRVEQVAAAEGSKASKSSAPAKAAAAEPEVGTADVKRGKQTKIKNVSEVAERAAQQANGSTSEEDISRWLLGLEGGGGDSMRETQTLSLEETTAITRGKPTEEVAADDNVVTDEATAEATDEVTDDSANGDAAASDAKENEESTGKSGGWALFKMGKKGGAKKSPGKLPPRPNEGSKDSREAAADILREMTRRR